MQIADEEMWFPSFASSRILLHTLSVIPSMCLKSGLGIGGKNDGGRAVNEKKGKQRMSFEERTYRQTGWFS